MHCAATKPSMHVKAATVRKWHVEERGWSDIGYHWFIRRSGFIEPGRDENLMGSHAKGFNAESIAVCLAGGMSETGEDEENFTPEQYETLRIFVQEKKDQYPGIEVLGHRELPKVKKSCPCFNVQAMLGEWELDAMIASEEAEAVNSFSEDLEGIPDEY